MLDMFMLILITFFFPSDWNLRICLGILMFVNISTVELSYLLARVSAEHSDLKTCFFCVMVRYAIITIAKW